MAYAQTTYPKLIGIFTNEYNNYYEYYRTEDEWDLKHGFEYRIYVGNPTVRLETRLANILKTVAYVWTDDDDYGNPIVEKWKIKNHYLYINGERVKA